MTLREEKVVHPLSRAAENAVAVDPALEDWLRNEVAPASRTLTSEEHILLSAEDVETHLRAERTVWAGTR